ncbi:hypothetical protein [Sphingobacterium sp. LRF_L2]|uniref:hypothetical protein n=1 Tax=Sphingobacterium sp. LRF_L2 TaxID=3369421 RepID=UPI003F5ECE3E
MGAFLDKIFGSKIEVDLVKIELEAELSFQECRMDRNLAQQISEQSEGQHSEGYDTFIRKLVLLEKEMYLPVKEEIRLLEEYIALYLKSANEYPFLRFDVKLAYEKTVPPLILFPLVLNALHLGYNRMEKYPLKIKIRSSEKSLFLEVSNRVNHHVSSQQDVAAISRYKNRLLFLFPDKHSLFFNSNSNLFKTNLQIDW